MRSPTPQLELGPELPSAAAHDGQDRRRLCAAGGVKALLLECTNLPPYKQALKARFDIEIFDILTLIDSIKSNLVDPAYL